MRGASLLNELYILPILLFSVVIHEVSHGLMALRCGDPTAKERGRITLNPIPHIDLVGSIIVPLFSLLATGRIFIAWAKPVPVNPMNFRHQRRDDILVSVVGPLSNLLMALLCAICAIVFVNGSAYLGSGLSPAAADGLNFFVKMFYGGVYLNVILAVFNLIPVPPLDGSHVVASLLPERAGNQYRQIGFFGIFLVLLLMRNASFSNVFGSIISTIAFPFELIIRTFI
jgi:Zn-dependent protease